MTNDRACVFTPFVPDASGGSSEIVFQIGPFCLFAR